MLGLAVDSITSFTVVPLRMITALGALVIFFSILMGIYILYIALIIGDVVKGWTSTIFAIYFIGGIQILCIAIIGEYIGKILIIEKNRPRYHIDERLL
jgi:glycosyltransferase involved in cell wall biosynthesis